MLGFPTANLEVDPAQIEALEHGVWAGWAVLPDGTQKMAVVNVGVRPTFGGQALSVEAHVVDFAGDLYGVEVALDLVAKVREEQRFRSAAELIAQIREDVEQARALLQGDRAEHNPTEV